MIELEQAEEQPKRVISGGVELDPEAQKQLRRAIAVRGWTPTELAREAHLSRPTVTRMLHGRGVSPETLAAVAQALHRGRVDHDLADLIDGKIE